MLGKCEHCGCDLKSLCIFVHGRKTRRLCKDCSERYTVSCEKCKTLILKDEDNRVEADGKLLCKSCINQYYVTCTHCKKIIRKEYAVRDEAHTILCQKCYSQYYYRCDYCESLQLKNTGEINLDVPTEEDGYTILCQECHNDFFRYCTKCGRLVYFFDMEIRKDGVYYCSSCYKRE